MVAFGEGEGVYRLAGQAQYSGGVVAWSLILKVLAQPTHGGSPTDWNYWRREADAYHSGALADLPGSVRAPHCYAVNEQPNGQVWVWMEYAREPSSLTWSLAEYRQIAYQLGEFNGAYLDGRPLQSGSWVSSQWLHGRVYSNEPLPPGPATEFRPPMGAPIFPT